MLHRSRSRYALVLVVALVLTACRADLVVDIALTGDGSGTVAASLSLDDDVVGGFDDLAGELRLEDLRGAGWEVDDPQQEDDGLTWIRMRKPFPSGEQLGEVLAELHPRLFPSASVDLSRSLERTTYSLRVQVDTTMQLVDFSDPDAAALLGTPLGFDTDDLARRAGGSLDDAVGIRLRVSLPDGNAVDYPAVGQPPLRLGGDGVVEFQVETDVVDEEVVAQLDRAERFRGARTWIWALAAVLWLLLLLVIVFAVTRAVRGRSTRRRPLRSERWGPGPPP